MTANGLTWWANRKSRMGQQPSAKAPPHSPGKPWWTTPPIAAPQPEFIEYAAQYRAELIAKKATAHDETEINGLLAYVNAWLKAAHRLLEEDLSTFRRDLQTTDGILIASCNAFSTLCDELVQRGGEIPSDVQAVIDAARARATKVMRDRVLHGTRPR